MGKASLVAGGMHRTLDDIRLLRHAKQHGRNLRGVNVNASLSAGQAGCSLPANLAFVPNVKKSGYAKVSRLCASVAADNIVVSAE